MMAQWVILRRWETIASVRAPVRDCPDLQRQPIRVRLGDRPPVCRGPEIARQCGAAVGQERPSGKPGGLFLFFLEWILATSRQPRGGALDRLAAAQLGGRDLLFHECENFRRRGIGGAGIELWG